jgi:hypothetical protein
MDEPNGAPVESGAAAPTEDSGGTLMGELAGGAAPAAEGDKAPAAGQEKAGGTLMTDLAGGKKEEPAGTEAEKEASKVPDKPEAYEFQFDEKTNVDQALLGNFRKEAHSMGLSRGQAQKLAKLWEGHVAGETERLRGEQLAAIEKAKSVWVAEIQAEPDYKQKEEHVKLALSAFGSPELFDIFQQTATGSHPVMWNFVANVGRELAEPRFRGRSAGGGREPSLPERMWPNMGKE